MTPMSLQDLCAYSDVGKHETGFRLLQARLREIAYRAGQDGEKAVESLARDVVRELDGINDEQEAEIGKLEAEIDENDTCRDEIEAAIAAKFSWTIAGNIMEDARAVGRQRRIEAAEAKQRLAS